MESTLFDRLTRSLAVAMRRRALLRGTAGMGAGIALVTEGATAKRKKKPKKKAKVLCRDNGFRCKKKGITCKAANCLRAPFSVEAHWTTANPASNTYLFLPKEPGKATPGPFIRSSCMPSASDCESAVYPFACVDTDLQGLGDEITTIRRLLKGTYEYWIYVPSNAPAGAATITLSNAAGRILAI